MRSEQLSNLHVGWALAGWLVAVAVTAAIYLGGVGLGLAGPSRGTTLWPSVSIAGGFFAGGLLVGMRWSDAPILHGVAITVLSVLVWFVVLLVWGTGGSQSVPLVLGLVLLQLAASCAGGWMGRRSTLGVGAATE